MNRNHPSTGSAHWHGNLSPSDSRQTCKFAELDKRTVLLIKVAIDVALHAKFDAVQKKAIAHRIGVPERKLDRIMHVLAHGGIVRGSRGPHGGYILSREQRHISLADIVMIAQQSQCVPIQPDASTYAESIIASLRSRINSMFFEYLSSITLEDLCRDLPDVSDVSKYPANFSI